MLANAAMSNAIILASFHGTWIIKVIQRISAFFKTLNMYDHDLVSFINIFATTSCLASVCKDHNPNSQTHSTETIEKIGSLCSNKSRYPSRDFQIYFYCNWKFCSSCCLIGFAPIYWLESNG